jgi:Bacterioferritin-associated ferredoxin
MLVCICNAVSESRIREAIREGAATLEALQSQLAVGTCCGKCTDDTCALLTEETVAHRNSTLAFDAVTRHR